MHGRQRSKRLVSSYSYLLRILVVKGKELAQESMRARSGQIRDSQFSRRRRCPGHKIEPSRLGFTLSRRAFNDEDRRCLQIMEFSFAAGMATCQRSVVNTEIIISNLLIS